jgi:glutaredoxin/glutathione-dependent peroxiredoxin|tara:strand:+ start:1180 stop:1665 length:486 start_codon:yes stop_codon:yes gene_type:complete
MSIKVGDLIPEEKLTIMTKESGLKGLSLRDHGKNKKIILIGIPGAFTPTCHMNHLPGYLEHYETIKSKGIDEIICFGTNDIFVMNAWMQSLNAGDKILALSDSKAKFSKALGTEYDDTFGTSIKTERLSILIDDCVVKQIFIEPNSAQAILSGALNMIDSL